MSRQARVYLLIIWLGLIGCILVIGYCMVINVAAIGELKSQVNLLEEEIKRIEVENQPHPTPETEVTEQPERAEETEEISRGDQKSEPTKMKVTAYDLSYQSCKKYPDHPEYGITASGVRVKEWHTIAAGPALPFGTQVFIPYFEDKPNKGIFTVEDRGSAIKDDCIDIYMPDYEDCMEFGIRELDVYVLD